MQGWPDHEASKDPQGAMNNLYQRVVTKDTLTITLEHNGIHPSDPNYKNYIKLVLKDGGDSMEVDGKQSRQVEIILKGDNQREVLIDFLKGALRELYGPIWDLDGPIPYG